MESLLLLDRFVFFRRSCGRSFVGGDRGKEENERVLRCVFRRWKSRRAEEPPPECVEALQMGMYDHQEHLQWTARMALSPGPFERRGVVVRRWGRWHRGAGRGGLLTGKVPSEMVQPLTCLWPWWDDECGTAPQPSEREEGRVLVVWEHCRGEGKPLYYAIFDVPLVENEVVMNEVRVSYVPPSVCHDHVSELCLCRDLEQFKKTDAFFRRMHLLFEVERRVVGLDRVGMVVVPEADTVDIRKGILYLLSLGDGEVTQERLALLAGSLWVRTEAATALLSHAVDRLIQATALSRRQVTRFFEGIERELREETTRFALTGYRASSSSSEEAAGEASSSSL